MNKWIKSIILLLFALTTTQWVQAQGAVEIEGKNSYVDLPSAISAAAEGDVLHLKLSQSYNLPGSFDKNITIVANDGVDAYITHSSGNISNISNGCTFKNIVFNLGNTNYHGFQHSGHIIMDHCTLNGRITSYGDLTFDHCQFVQDNSDYHMWCYSGNVTYQYCTFTNNKTGKFINVYHETGSTRYTITANNCRFINNASSNKAALNVKATGGSNLLKYDVIINNCSTQGSFPEASRSDALVVLNSLAQVDDRTASGVDNITVTQDGVLIYPFYVAAIGEAKYPTLQSAVNAAQQMGGEQTINIIDNISEETVTINEVANFKLTIDGQKDASSNYTVDATIVVDGLRGNGGSTTNGASVTLQNIAFVKTTATDGIQASHYPHNLTIQDCTYSGFDNDKWFLNASVYGPLYGVTVKDVTVENGRLIYANMAEDAVFQNITATNDIKVGFNVKTSGTALIENCQVTTGKYAFRDYSDGYAGTFTLKNNTFVSTSEESDEGVIVNRGGVVGTTHINVESGTYTGHLKVLNNKEGVLAISDGYFSEEFPQSYIAADLVAQGKVCVPATDKEGFYTIGDPHYVAQIGETGYTTLTAAVNAAQSGQTIELLDNITEETGNKSLKAGVTLDGKGKTISGDIAIYISKDGGTVQNVNFKNIHNASNKKSAIYSEYLEGTATITGCTFDNCDWDAIQILPKEGSNVIITNNTFTDDNEDGVKQKRYIHIQSAENVDFSITVNDNVMLGDNGGPMDVYYPKDKTKVNLSNNYIETVDDVLCVLLVDDDGFAGELAFPAYTSADKEETYTPETYIQNDQYSAKFYMTFAEAAEVAGNEKVITLITKPATAYTMSEGQVLKVKKNGKSITVNGPAGWVVKSTTTNGVTTYTLVEADIEYTATNGTVKYINISNTFISGSGTYKLLKDVTANVRINPGVLASDVTIDLNGYTLTSAATDEAVLLSRAGTATSPKKFALVDNSEDGGGKLVVNPNASHAILVNNAGTTNAKYTDVTIGKGVTIEGGCVSMLSQNCTLIVEGTINGGNDFAIATNGGTTTDTDITIKDGAVLTSNEVAMYLPGTGTTTIEEGATITGSTGVYVKSGTVNITGGEITGNGTKADYAYNDNGCNSTGNALVVENCGYPGGAPTVNVSGGTFTSVNNDAIASYKYGDEQEVIQHFVHGGYFSDQVAQELIEEGKKCVPAPEKEGYYKLDDILYVAQNVNSGKKYEKLQTALDEAQEGNEIKILADITQGTVNSYITPNGRITKGITIDGDGHTLTNTSTYVFEITGSGEVTINNTTMVSQTSRGLLVGHENPAFTSTLNINNCTITSNRMGIQIVDPGITVNLNNTIVQSDVDDPISNYTSGNQNGREFTGIDLSDKNITVNLTDCEIRGFRNCFGCETYTSPENNVVNMTGGKTYGLYVFSHTISLNTNAQHLTYNFEDVDIQSQYLLEEFGRLITVNKVYLTGSTTLPASGKVIDDEGKLCEGMIMMDETVAALYDGKFDNYKVVETTEEPGYTIALKGGNLLVFHDSGNYEQAFVVPMYTRIPGANIYYKVNGGSKTQYTEPLTISADTQLEVWIQVGDTKIGEPITRNYAIVERPAGPSVADGYYYIKNEGNSKYVNVAGRKTVTFKSKEDAEKAAGTVIRVKAAEGGAVETLRSQAVDLPGYAKRAMNYVPEMVRLIVNKLHADGGGNILGENGVDAIMTKFNKSFDYNLYLEEANGGLRIYGRTPSMKPVVDFYYENKDKVDAKLPELEGFINNAIDKLKNKLEGHGASILQPFSVHAVWQEMGGTLTEPVDEESTSRFYEEVLASEANVWSFAYETAMMYYEPLMEKIENGTSGSYQELIDQLGDYKKYLDKLPQVRPNTKYYIVAKDGKMDFISEGNIDITNNEANAIWTLEERTDFTVAFEKENLLVDGLGTKYYTTLYTDFAYEMPENAKAYAVTGYNMKDIAELQEITGVIPAMTPVLLMTQDESLAATLTLSTEAGTAPEVNLLKGADWIINEYQLKTAQLQTLFDIVKGILGENSEFYQENIAQYEHLMLKNAGLVNNKYFFGLSGDDLDDVENLRVLGMGYVNKLGFHDVWTELKANEAFLIEEPDPVLIPLWPDVNCDGIINVADVTALVEIVLNNDVYGPDWIFPYYNHSVADIDQDGIINVTDVTTLVTIVLNLRNNN